jgi:hypothetical protein
MHRQNGPAEGAGTGPPPLLNLLSGAAFAIASIVFLIYYVKDYTVLNSGRAEDMAVGLWGWLSYSALAWGAVRARPRAGQRGWFQTLHGITLAQAVLFSFVWGSALFDSPVRYLSYLGFAAFFAGPLLAVGYLFVARRHFPLVLAEFLSPVAILLVVWIAKK